MNLRSKRMIGAVGALVFVAGFVCTSQVKAVTKVQFTFDPTILVEQSSSTPYGQTDLRVGQDDPRRIHVGSGIGANSRAYFQTFYGDTDPFVQPNWYSRGHYQDNFQDPGSSAAPGSVTPVATDPFDQLFNATAADGGGKLVVNYFNLFIPEQGDMPLAGDPIYDWVPSPISRVNGTLVQGGTEGTSNWTFFDTGVGATGPMFSKAYLPDPNDPNAYRGGLVDDNSGIYGLFANNTYHDYGQFSFEFYTNDAVQNGDEFTFWFGTNAEEVYNMLFDGPVTIDGTQMTVDQISGFEGAITLRATIVPEPSTVALSLMGGILLGVGALRRRRIRINAKALSLCLVAGVMIVATVVQAAPKVVRSSEAAAVVGLKGTLEVFDAQGEVRKIRSLASAPRIQPPALLHVARGAAMLRVGEMYVQVPEDAWINLVKNEQARSIELAVPSFSEIPSKVFIETRELSLTKGQVVRASYDFVNEQVQVSTGRMPSQPVAASRVAMASVPSTIEDSSSTIS